MGGADRGLPGPAHGDARRDRGERRAPLDRARAAFRGGRPAVGGDRVRAAQRRADAPRRARVGCGGPPPGICRRADLVHSGVAGQRARADGGGVDRRQGRAGPGRGAAHTSLALSIVTVAYSGAQRAAALSGVGRDRRGRRGGRGADRRDPHQLARLAICVPDQRARGTGRRRAQPAPGAAIAAVGRIGPGARPDRRPAGHGRTGDGGVRDQRGARAWLGVGQDPAAAGGVADPCWPPSRWPSGRPGDRWCRRAPGGRGRWWPGWRS